MEKTLRLERRGCEYFAPDKGRDDVGNYRVGTYDYSVRGKDGRDYILEFGASDLVMARCNNLMTGAPLKRPVMELVKAHALYVNVEYKKTEPDGLASWMEGKIARKIRFSLLDYSQAGILEAVNKISADHYTAIEWIR